MKKQNSLLTLLILLLIFSCSSDDKQTDEEGQTNNNSKLFKKSEVFSEGILNETIEVFYNNNSNIERVIENKINYLKRTYTINYSGSNISGVTIETEAVPPYTFDSFINYNNVTIDNNLIVLISDTSDQTMEIIHLDGYVNSIKDYETSHPINLNEERFTRNSDNQIITINGGLGIFEYSNFDSNKKNVPLSQVIYSHYKIMLLILNLKFSSDNPMTSYNNQEGTYNVNLEYDEQGYVIKVNNDEPNSIDNYATYEYIEQ